MRFIQSKTYFHLWGRRRPLVMYNLVNSKQWDASNLRSRVEVDK